MAVTIIYQYFEIVYKEKEQGNARFRAGDIKGAVGKYERAASYYPSDADLEKGKAYGEDVDGQKAAARATKLSRRMHTFFTATDPDQKLP